MTQEGKSIIPDLLKNHNAKERAKAELLKNIKLLWTEILDNLKNLSDEGDFEEMGNFVYKFLSFFGLYCTYQEKQGNNIDFLKEKCGIQNPTRNNLVEVWENCLSQINSVNHGDFMNDDINNVIKSLHIFASTWVNWKNIEKK